MAVVNCTPEEARALVERGEVIVLDVRTRQEFVQLGHVPGARLLPVDLIASAVAKLDAESQPVLVCCEHGIRSAHAADVLVRAGVGNVYNMTGGMAAWQGARVFDDTELWGPSEWLLEQAGHLRGAGRVLDVACGRGRHALLLAAAGFDVTAIDRDVEALDHIAQVATRCAWPVRTVEMDLEKFPAPELPGGPYDVILVFRYLFRPLFPSLARALAPGGRLIYETFLTSQASIGHPRNPQFLLAPGELASLLALAGLEVLAGREGLWRDAHVASAVARKH